jgi:hypothetical protein
MRWLEMSEMEKKTEMTEKTNKGAAGEKKVAEAAETICELNKT